MDAIVEAIKSLEIHDYYDWLILIISVIVPVSTALINVYIVNRNTNKQIANQNKETYRPRLRLKKVQRVSGYIRDSILYAYSERLTSEETRISLYFNVILENIGNGLANDINFYMLNNGEQCCGFQVGDYNESQFLDSTLEIAIHESDKVLFCINFNRNLIKPRCNFPNNKDSILLICSYKDLNNNNYKILIGIELKNILNSNQYNKIYDDQDFIKYNYYYHQEGTDKFNRIIGKSIYEDSYKRILKQIDNN